MLDGVGVVPRYEMGVRRQLVALMDGPAGDVELDHELDPMGLRFSLENGLELTPELLVVGRLVVFRTRKALEQVLPVHAPAEVPPELRLRRLKKDDPPVRRRVV